MDTFKLFAMRNFLQFLLISGLVLIMSACATPSPTPLSTPQENILFTSSPTSPASATIFQTPDLPQPTTTPIPLHRDPSPTPVDISNTLPLYKIEATLNYAQHHLAVDQQILFTNQYDEPLSELLLVVEPARYPGTFILEKITWLDGSPIDDFSREIGLLRIPLDDPLQPGGKTGISIAYELDIPSPSPSYFGRPVPFGYSSRQTNLVDWYPFIPPYQPGNGWVAHQPGAFGEHLVYEVADFEVNIQISDTNQDLLIAASAPGVSSGGWWQYRLDAARNFSWSVSDQYELSTTTVDSILVLSYFFPIDSQAGEAVLRSTAEALALYDDLFGPYPRQTLSVVEADFLDGMEYDGLYFLSKGFYNLYSEEPGDYLTAIAAHETAHQWWYSAVGNDQALEPWLDEALSTYCERLYYEKQQPLGLDWWWSYRINYYNPQGWVDGSIYNPQGYRAYRDAVYLNGANFMEDLRDLIGDEAFFTFLKAYSKNFSQRIATSDDFFALLEEYSQEDLNPLIAEYFKNR
jgi:hypothetical protein